MDCQKACTDKTEPDSYYTIMALEHKRYQSAIEEASELIVQLSSNGSNGDTHRDHLDRTRTVHTITKMMSSILWEDYILGGLGEMLVLNDITREHTLSRKRPDRRSQFETYTASLRALLKQLPKSYIMKVLIPGYSLKEIQANIEIIVAYLNDAMKYAESVMAILEKYLAWIEHGAAIATAYVNTSRQDDDDKVEVSDMYSDIKVRAYAMLKISDLDASKMASYLDDINHLIARLNSLVSLFHKLYTSTDPQTFENIFNAMIAKKVSSSTHGKTKFENIHELNEYIRQHTIESIEEPQGFMYNVNELLDEARGLYIDKLATEITEILSFLPNKTDHKRFINQFESGKIWQNTDGQ
jgi:hypothetical protein